MIKSSCLVQVKKLANASKPAVKEERQPAKKKRPRESEEEDDDDDEEEEEEFIPKKKKKVWILPDRLPWPSKLPSTAYRVLFTSHDSKSDLFLQTTRLLIPC